MRFLFLAKAVSHAPSSLRKNGQRASGVAVWRTLCIVKVRDDVDIGLFILCVCAEFHLYHVYTADCCQHICKAPASFCSISSKSHSSLFNNFFFVESGKALQVVPLVIPAAQRPSVGIALRQTTLRPDWNEWTRVIEI